MRWTRIHGIDQTFLSHRVDELFLLLHTESRRIRRTMKASWIVVIDLLDPAAAAVPSHVRSRTTQPRFHFQVTCQDGQLALLQLTQVTQFLHSPSLLMKLSDLRARR